MMRLITAAALALTSTFVAANHPTVTELGWMTGSWSGKAGAGVELEENWSAPRAGTMGSIVRMVGETTSTVSYTHLTLPTNREV